MMSTPGPYTVAVCCSARMKYCQGIKMGLCIHDIKDTAAPEEHTEEEN
jgi:hypothetical protein